MVELNGTPHTVEKFKPFKTATRCRTLCTDAIKVCYFTVSKRIQRNPNMRGSRTSPSAPACMVLQSRVGWDGRWYSSRSCSGIHRSFISESCPAFSELSSGSSHRCKLNQIQFPPKGLLMEKVKHNRCTMDRQLLGSWWRRPLLRRRVNLPRTIHEHT